MPRPIKTTDSTSRTQTGLVRLQRVLAQAGCGSRRECETLILEGRVVVDGQTADRLGMRVDPQKQKILFDGTPIRAMRFQYFAVNKPPGVVSTSRDPAGRLRVIDLIKTDQRVYNVGRLDKSSEGLILVTNDGDLANRLTHPRYGVAKTYLVTVVGRPTLDDLQTLKRGVYLAEGKAQVSEIRIKKRRKQSTDLRIVLDEGRNREIRRLLAHIGHKVTRLKRIAIGPLQLGDLPLGAFRRLEYKEINALRHTSLRGARRSSDRAGRRETLGRKKTRPGAKKKTGAKKKSGDSTKSFSSERRPASAKKKTSKKQSTASGFRRTLGSQAREKAAGWKARSRRSKKTRSKSYWAQG